MRERTVVGLLLCAIGVALLAAQQLRAGGEMVVALIGAGFLAAYAFVRSYALLVPGSILTGLGIGIVFESRGTVTGGGPVLLGLGLGFVLIYVVDRLVSGGLRTGGWWPLIPGGALSIIGASLVAGDLFIMEFVARWWPAAFIILGLWIMFRPRREAPQTPASPASPPDTPGPHDR